MSSHMPVKFSGPSQSEILAVEKQIATGTLRINSLRTGKTYCVGRMWTRGSNRISMSLAKVTLCCKPILEDIDPYRALELLPNLQKYAVKEVNKLESIRSAKWLSSIANFISKLWFKISGGEATLARFKQAQLDMNQCVYSLELKQVAKQTWMESIKTFDDELSLQIKKGPADKAFDMYFAYDRGDQINSQGEAASVAKCTIVEKKQSLIRTLTWGFFEQFKMYADFLDDDRHKAKGELLLRNACERLCLLADEYAKIDDYAGTQAKNKNAGELIKAMQKNIGGDVYSLRGWVKMPARAAVLLASEVADYCQKHKSIAGIPAVEQVLTQLYRRYSSNEIMKELDVILSPAKRQLVEQAKSLKYNFSY